jgi:hypothetical protein
MTIYENYARNDRHFFWGHFLAMAAVAIGATTTFPSCSNLLVAIFTQGGAMAMKDDHAIKEPLDLIRFSFDECIYVKFRANCELHGKLHVNIFLCT